MIIFLMIASLFFTNLYGQGFEIQKLAAANNPCNHYSLINSVDFHPSTHKFCVTYTQGNKVIIYEKKGDHKIVTYQTLANPQALLSEPQHAVFSPDGKWVIVSNWTNQTFNLYRFKKNQKYSSAPVVVIQPDANLSIYKPHGLAFSSDGKWIGVAYGAGSEYERAIAIFAFDPEEKNVRLSSCLRGKEELGGVPKGITFSNDGRAILVTYSDLNCIALFSINKNGQIGKKPFQTIRGPHTKISRPEDIKISPDQTYCALTNSDAKNVAFFAFDAATNTITNAKPIHVMKDDNLIFPHGIAFSSDGTSMAITQFSPISSDSKGDISWDPLMNPQEAKVSLFQILKKD